MIFRIMKRCISTLLSGQKSGVWGKLHEVLRHKVRQKLPREGKSRGAHNQFDEYIRTVYEIFLVIFICLIYVKLSKKFRQLQITIDTPQKNSLLFICLDLISN